MSKTALTIQVQARDESGTSVSRRLRRGGRIPAVIYGHGHDATAISFDEMALHDLSHHAGLVELDVEGSEPRSVVVKDVQQNPITGGVLHIDFLEVRADEIVTSTVTVEAHGEPAGASVGGILEQATHEIEVSCKALDMFEMLTVDVSHIELDQTLHARDLVLPEGVELLTDPDQAIFQVRVPQMQEIVAETEDEEAGLGLESEGEGEGADGGADEETE